MKIQTVSLKPEPQPGEARTLLKIVAVPRQEPIRESEAHAMMVRSAMWPRPDAHLGWVGAD